MKNTCLLQYTIGLFLLLIGCKQETNREAIDWGKAVAENRIETYEQFLSKYPNTALLDSINRQIERLRERAYFEKYLLVGQPLSFTAEFLLFRPENLGYDHPLQGFPLILGRAEDSTLIVLDCFRASKLKTIDSSSKGVELNVATDLPPLVIKTGIPYRLSGFWVEERKSTQPDSLAVLIKVQREKLETLVESGKEPSASVYKEFYAGVLAERLKEQHFDQVKIGWLLQDGHRSVLQNLSNLGRKIEPGKIFVVEGVE